MGSGASMVGNRQERPVLDIDSGAQVFSRTTDSKHILKAICKSMQETRWTGGDTQAIL